MLYSFSPISKTFSWNLHLVSFLFEDSKVSPSHSEMILLTQESSPNFGGKKVNIWSLPAFTKSLYPLMSIMYFLNLFFFLKLEGCLQHVYNTHIRKKNRLFSCEFYEKMFWIVSKTMLAKIVIQHFCLTMSKNYKKTKTKYLIVEFKCQQHRMECLLKSFLFWIKNKKYL